MFILNPIALNQPGICMYMYVYVCICMYLYDDDEDVCDVFFSFMSVGASGHVAGERGGEGREGAFKVPTSPK